MLKGLKILSLVHDEFEDLELWYPIYRLREAGAEVQLAGELQGQIYHGKYGVPARADMSFEQMQAADFHGLLVPGGWAPDKLRRFPKVLELVQEMDKERKPIGQICHAGWVLISAKILQGRKVTSTPGIKDDMENAGATWIDLPALTDGHLVSAQRPPDLPAYMIEFIHTLRNRYNL